MSDLRDYKTGHWAVGKAQVGFVRRKKEKILRVVRRWQVDIEMQTALVLARVVSTGFGVCLDAKTCAGWCRIRFKCSAVCCEKLAVFCQIDAGGSVRVKLLPRQGRKGAAVKSSLPNQHTKLVVSV